MCVISVIVPVYNSGLYLEKSIKSLIKQTIFEQLDVIIIDDGSTDNSLSILQEYASKYNNIKVFHQENAGVSVARNKGIQEAEGEYIAFFDSDDIVEPCHYENLLNIIQSGNYDVGIANYKMVFSDGYIKNRKKRKIKEWNSSEKVVIDFLKGDLICNNPIDKIFTRQAIQNIWFPEGFAVGEDMFFLYEVLKKSKAVKLDSYKSTYHYIFRDQSAMKSPLKDIHLDGIRLSHRMWKNEKKVEVKKYAEANYIHEICKYMNRLFSSKSVCSSEYTDEIIKDLKTYSLLKAIRFMNMKHFVAFFLMKISPRIYSKIYQILRMG